MFKQAFYRLFSGILLLLAYSFYAHAQEKASIFTHYSADISYGMPFYQGDFENFINAPMPFNGSMLGGAAQYNQSSISGSLTLPWRYNISFRLRATQTILFFTEALASVNFKNTVNDISFLIQYNIPIKRFNLYLMAGVGYHSSYDATIYNTIKDTELGQDSKQIQRMSSTFGLGMEVNVWRQFNLFLEGDWNFTGSDHFDGYNGYDALRPERSKEKPYFLRDQLVTARSGIRVYFVSNSKLIAERSFSQISSAHYDNPYTGKVIKTDEDDLPEELRKLGVKKKLTGYTLEVNKVISIDELKRQKESGEKVISSIQQNYKNAKVELLLEPNGFSIHIGGFGSLKEAKNAIYTVRRYYNAALVQRH